MSTQMPRFETERLILRPFVMADALAVTDLLQDLRIHQCTQNIPYPYSLQMAYEWIASHLNRSQLRAELVLAITTKKGNVMGMIGLQIDMRHLSGEIGFWLGSDFRRRGYCLESLRKIVSYAFHKVKLNRLHACYFDWNEASGKVLRNAGFRQEGISYQSVRKQGVFQNLVHMALLAEEWDSNEE